MDLRVLYMRNPEGHAKGNIKVLANFPCDTNAQNRWTLKSK
jgi:hypothetical protein